MKPGYESAILPERDPPEERLRLIFEQAAVGVALTDRQTGRFLKINQKYCDLLGYSVAEMLAKGYQDVTHPGDLEFDLERTARLRSGELARYTREKRYLHKNGAVIWANLTVSTLCEAGEVPRFNIATVEDITARKQAEAALLAANEQLEARVAARTFELEAANRRLQRECAERAGAEASLRESEQRFRTMVDSISQLAWVTDSEGNIIWVNRRTYEYTGLPLEQLHGWQWQRLIEPSALPKVHERWLGSINSGEPFDIEYPLLGHDGNYRRFLTRAVPLRDANGKVVQWFGTCTDITRLKEAEEELRRHRDGLDVLVRERTAELEGRNAQLEIEITERKRAECALSQSEQRFRAVVEDQTELIARYSPDGSYSFVNEVFCRFLGSSEAELIGSRWQPHANPEDLALIEKRLGYLSPENPVVVVENRVLSGAGEERWLQFVNRGFFDEDGRLLETQAVARDITERKFAEQMLHVYADEVQDLYNNAPCGYHSLDGDGVFVRMNDTELGWLGYQRHEIIGVKHFTDLVTPESAEYFRAHFPKFLEQGWISDLEFEMVRRDGSRFPVIISAVALKDPDGNYLMSRGMVFDNTERKKAEEERRRSEEKYRGIFENAPFGIFQTSVGGRLIRVNPSLVQMFGFESPQQALEALGGDVSPVYQQLDQRDRMIAQALASERYAEGEVTFLRRGTPFVANLRIRAVRSGEGTLLEGFVEDITERKHAEEGLRRYARRLVELEENLRKRIAMELHDDIGQVLTALGLNLAHIGLRLERGEGRDLAEVLEDSRQLTKEISRSVRNLMVDLHPVQMEEYGLAAAVRSHAEQFAQRTGIQVAVQTDPECPRLNAAQEITLFRITQEALNNIVKYAQAGKVAVKLCSRGDLVSFSIADDGVGFLPRAVAPQPAGSGWGLTIMRERAELNGGVFRVVSEPGAGTTISVDFRGKG
jgi:PAS domain S-box-containing protein